MTDKWDVLRKEVTEIRWLTKVKILKRYFGFVCFETSKTEINLPIDARQERFFSASIRMNFLRFTITVRRKKLQETSSPIHFFNKPSVVKQLSIETGAFHIYLIPCIRSFRCLISHTLWPRMIFLEGYPSISPSFFLETWTVPET